jgi:AraC-like DNA-binding protein
MSQEVARYWQHPGLPGVDLLRARFVRQRYSRHTHETYVIALIDRGVEEFDHQGTRMRAGPGEIVLVNPDTVHTGHAGIPGGWTYRVFYPAAELMAGVAAELLAPPGPALPTGRASPYFPDAVVSDPVSSRLLGAAHLAAAESDELAASSMLHAAVATLLSRHAAGPRGPEGRRAALTYPERLPRRPALRAAAAAREILDERLTDPPRLSVLAAAVDASPFSLLRAFRADTGLPPHAYVNQRRVRLARDLLSQGMRPADVAARVGFADQAHLTRHFKRIVGVPPRAYQRGRKNVQDGAPRTA